MQLTVRYEQYTQEKEVDGRRPTLAGWRGRDGDWLREAVARRRTEGAAGWIVATRRGFRSRVGAAGRKYTEVYAARWELRK